MLLRLERFQPPLAPFMLPIIFDYKERFSSEGVAKE